MKPVVSSKRCLAIICLFLLLVLYAPAAISSSNYTARENPANVTASNGLIDYKTLAIMAEMYQSLGKVTLDLNQSSFDLAKIDLASFKLLYDSNKDCIGRLYDSNADAINAINSTDMTVADIQTYIDKTADYNKTFQLYKNYMANGDTANATALAVTLDAKFKQLNVSYDDLHINSILSLDMLDNTNQKNVNSSLIRPFLSTTDYIMALQTAEQDSINVKLSDYSVTLMASSSEAHIDDSLIYTVVVRQSSSDDPVNGANVELYVNDVPTASGVTDATGACQIPYKVSEDLSRSQVNVYAKYTPTGQTMLPAISNVLDLHILDENTILSLSLSPRNATFGDTIRVKGRLASVRGFPARDSPVVIYLGSTQISRATTDDNGTYDLSFRINEQTPGGQSNVYAVHDRASGSFFVGSSSSSVPIEVTPLHTKNVMRIDELRFTAGDMMPISGTLVAENGIPVDGADIAVYMDDYKIGSGSTDYNGHYTLNARIPYDSSAGNHSIYTVYVPSGGSLYTSSSNKAVIHVASITTSIAINGAPLILFINDTLNVTGSMHTSDGKPVRGQAVVIQVSDSIGGTVVTDDTGNFSYSRVVNAYDPAGIYTISAYMQPISSPVKTASAVAGYVIILPIDKSLALVAYVVDIVLIILALLVVRYGLNMSKLIDRLTGRSKEDAELDDLSPVSPEEQLQPQQVKKQPSFEDIAGNIDTSIDTGDFTDASMRMYVAVRSLAINKGLHITDSDTHREFYRSAAESYPQIATPLRSIVNLYERMTFGHGNAGLEDLKHAYDSLKEVYLVFTSAEASG